RLPVGRPAVSKHLRVLSDAGLIEHRSSGTRNLYELAPGGLAVARQWLTQTWDTALAAYADEAAAGAAAPPRAARGRRSRRRVRGVPRRHRPLVAPGRQERARGRRHGRLRGRPAR